MEKASELRIKRLKAGITLQEMREITSISTGRLSSYERGMRPTPQAKILISKALNLSIRELWNNEV